MTVTAKENGRRETKCEQGLVVQDGAVDCENDETALRGVTTMFQAKNDWKEGKRMREVKSGGATTEAWDTIVKVRTISMHS